MYVAGDSGYYSVQVTDTNGCSAVSNPVFITTTGIPVMGGDKGIIVYPNPFGNFIYIQQTNLSKKIQQVRIYDVPGRLVLSASPVDQEPLSTVWMFRNYPWECIS